MSARTPTAPGRPADTHCLSLVQLMVRADLQQLASNPLILSMVLSYIRTATQAQASAPLNRWRLYHSAMSTIITRLDAKTLEARKGQARLDPVPIGPRVSVLLFTI